MPKPKTSIQDLSLKTVIHSKARNSFCTYTDLHPTQSKPSGCPPEYKIHFCYLKLCVQDQCSSTSPTSACRFKNICISMFSISLQHWLFVLLCFICRIPLFRFLSETRWNHQRTPDYWWATINMGAYWVHRQKLHTWAIQTHALCL